MTQKEKIFNELQNIKIDISSNDRLNVARIVGVDPLTVKRYIDERVANENTGVKILRELRKIIKRREDIITS